MKTFIDIEASAPRVWGEIVAIEDYPEWNPFVRRVAGDLAVGAELDVLLELPGSKPMKMKPRLTVFSPQQELRWLGHLGFPGIFSGEHVFRLEEQADGATRFFHEEFFSGFLVPVLWPMLKKKTLQGFEAMNKALKVRAETIGH